MFHTAPKRRRLKRKKIHVVDVLITIFCITCAIICFYPMWYVIVVSITPYETFVHKTVILLPPLKPDFQYYLSIFTSTMFKRSIFVSVFKTVVATALSVLVTTSMAYAVSKSNVRGMKVLNVMAVVTLYFTGGLIPTYMLYNDIGILETIFPMILPAAFNVSYFVITRNYFAYSISAELEEAATIDGANQVIIFFRLILPLSAPMIAAVSLFIAVGQWNDYYSYMMFVNKPELQPLVWVLRRMLTDSTFTQSVQANAQQMLGQTYVPAFALRMSTIVVAMLPIMIVYPFIQPYFAKGIMVGAVKG